MPEVLSVTAPGVTAALDQLRAEVAAIGDPEARRVMTAIVELTNYTLRLAGRVDELEDKLR